MTKKNIILFVVIILIILAIGVVFYLKFKTQNNEINSSGIINLNTEEIYKNKKKYILVSGEVFTSFPVEVKIKESRIGDMVVLTLITCISKKPETSFVYAVKLDDTVKQIVLGKDKKNIWEKIH